MKRPGYTLLEVVLAAAIGVLVMSALYVAMEIQLRQTQMGRDVVEESVLVRSLLNRLSRDITASLTAPPKGSGDAANGTQSYTTSPATPTTQQPANSNANQNSQGNTASTTPSSEMGSASFNLGLVGSYDRLELQVSRPPRIPQAVEGSTETPLAEGDLRRITYWLTPGGLAREEVQLVSGTDLVESLDEADLVIAPEVRNIQFRYFDGATWQESWDGSAVGGDGQPKGPPLAVEILLDIGPASEEAMFDPAGASGSWKRYRHVVALPTASLPVGEITETAP